MDQPAIDTKALFAPKKGKQATKGQKQIYEGNKETIKFYSIVWAGGSLFLKFTLSYLLSATPSLLLTIFAILVQSGAIAGMYFMSRPVVAGASKTVVDGGIDLNLKGGFADYLIDLIVTTAACTVLSIFSEKFWIIWLWLPILVVYKIWMSVIAPWIFQPAPEENVEVAEKKRKKMDRKMARAGYR